jgi:hypothetical protein
MRLLPCSLAIVGSVSVLSAFQQPSVTPIAQPDFSGHWTLASGHNPVVTGRANRPDGQLQIGVTPHELMISLSGDVLRIEEHRFGPSPHLVTMEYGLKGQSTTGEFLIEPLRPAAPSVATSKLENNKLVSTIDVVVPGEPDPRHYIETLSISAEGILAVRIQRAGTPDSRTLFYQKAK